MEKHPEKQQKSLSFMRRILFTVCSILLAVASVSGQVKHITGHVTDTKKEPLIGVSVMISGTTTGTVTDIDGNYALQASPGATLEFSYVGMAKTSVTVGDKNVINVTMQDDSQLLSETVVIGYGSAKKRDLTGSISNVKGADIANKPSSNPLASLQGKVAGVQVVNSGRAGADPEIRIRGTNSINGYTPLYIVDGLFNDNINFLNPSDIESMEILKDPSSLAIFGVRGANGVIIVTTKKAKEGQTMINLNSSFGWKHVSDKIDMVNAAQFKELYNEQLTNQGVAPFDFSAWNADTDWQDQIFQNGFITNNNVSLTGATDKHSFYMGVGYASEEGNIKHEKFSKVTVNMNSDYQMTDNFRLGFQFNGARLLPTDAKEVLNAVRATPVAPVFNEEFGLYTVLPDFQKGQINNPMVDVELKKNTIREQIYRGSGNIFGELKFLENFTFKAMFSMDYISKQQRKYTPIMKVYDAASEGSVETLGTKKTSVEQCFTNEAKVQGDYLVTYINNWGGHNLTATAGFTTYYNAFNSLTAGRGQGDGLTIANNPDKWYVSIGDAATATNASKQWERTTVSGLGRILYNYNSRYLFNASFRRDGSSAFSYTGNQWQNFYSVGAGWMMTEEAFMRNQRVLDMLKLKGSWGTLGNQNMSSAYPAEPLLENSSSAVFGDNIIPGYQLSYLPNPTLRWEKVEAWEAGFEANSLRNRLHLEAVFYSKHTKDLLATVPGLSGTVPGLGNLGGLNNRGVEIAASWKDQIGDFGYSVGANMTTIRNRVTSLVQKNYAIIDGDKSQCYTMAGFPIGFFYGYKVEGVYQNEAEIANSPVNKLATVTPGDLKFRDMDGDGQITEKDRTIIGNPTPDIIYGFNINLSYKNFELGIDMMGQGGNQIYRTWDNYNWSQFNFMAARMNRWHGEGTSNTEPILNTKHTINNMNSEYYIEDGSFFRLRNVSLAYNFDRNMLKKIRVQALRLYVNGQNLKTWKHNTGYTPELGGTATAFGCDGGSYPMPAIYTFGFNLTF
ncbi:MAG: TonB-dependent receptor [Bacteroidales bacterium]